MHQRVLVVLHRLDEVGAPRRRGHGDRLQLDAEVVGHARRERVLVVGRLVRDRRVEGDDARLLVVDVCGYEARVDPARQKRPHRHVRHQPAGDRVAQLAFDEVRERGTRLARERGQAIRIDEVGRLEPAVLVRLQ